MWKIALLCSNVRSIAWDGLYTSLSKKESRGMARTCIILLINLRLFPSSVVLHTTSIHRGRGLIDRSGEESDISVGMGKMCPPPLPLIDGANESWDTREGGKGNKKEGKRRWGGMLRQQIGGVGAPKDSFSHLCLPTCFFDTLAFSPQVHPLLQ